MNLKLLQIYLVFLIIDLLSSDFFSKARSGLNPNTQVNLPIQDQSHTFFQMQLLHMVDIIVIFLLE